MKNTSVVHSTTYETIVKDGQYFKAEHFTDLAVVSVTFLNALYEPEHNIEITVEDAAALAEVFTAITNKGQTQHG
jgi:hypothetical protein